MRQFYYFAFGLGLASNLLIAGPSFSFPAPVISNIFAPILAQNEDNISMNVLQNATYNIPGQGSYPLSNGSYQQGDVTLNLIKPTAIADINDDGEEDAAAILALQTGGSGTFMYLAIVTSQGNDITNLDTIPLGDRVRVQSLTIKDGQVRLKMLKHKDSDPMCCPTNLVTEAYQLDDSGEKLAPITLSEAQKQQIYVEDTPLPLIDKIDNDNTPVQPQLGEVQIKL